MGLKCGVIGLPNVGKSTIFNALTALKAEASNYPFCTIKPNIGQVVIPDARLTQLAAFVDSKQIIPATVSFVDIAGLVRNAHKGEGLGNQFLGHVLEMDALAHVVRCFESGDIAHVEGTVDPLRDIGIIETEIILKDIELLERYRDRQQKIGKAGDKAARAAVEVADQLIAILNDLRPLRSQTLSDAQAALVAELTLLSNKPMIFVVNTSETHDDDASVAHVRQYAEQHGCPLVVMSGKLEEELVRLDEEERALFMDELGVSSLGLAGLIHEAFRALNLITFFTANKNELRAWTIPSGTKAPQAAGTIHTDFERGFIAAEVIGCDDYIAHKGEHGAKENGSMRLEGKEYIVRDGDVILFRFNV